MLLKWLRTTASRTARRRGAGRSPGHRRWNGLRAPTWQRKVAATSRVVIGSTADALLCRCDPTEPMDLAGLEDGLGTMEARYEDLKAQLLAAGADARLTLTDMEQALRRCSTLRRATQQLQ